MNDSELQSYAYSLIVAFETKRKMQARPHTVKQIRVINSYIRAYLKAKKSGILDALNVIKDSETVNQRILQLA
ncbi:hypothetical protein GVX81_08810 [[Haemophilus] felis]|uniref:Uncharacterized protein n=1 Tax=[Haemophilus] felis TaxID=123822 RepID=A0A1T0AXE9_9PAST|nr:hypothetical protein [[Haemophilus] felis]OOS02472.1 hypothetical protein B0188_08585 [[Haemophilus] felis]